MELADDSSVANVNLAPLGVNDEDGGTGNLTADWVHSIVNQTEREMGVPLPTDVVSPASRGLDQATSSILDNVKSTTHIEDNLNQFADNAATDQSNVIDNTIVPSLQQHLNFNSEAVAELRPNVFGSTVISTSHSQQRPIFNGQSSLLTNSYVPKMSLWVNNHAAATTSSSLTTTRPAPIFTACTNTNVVSTTAVIPPRAHGSVHYGSSPFPTQTLVLPNTGPISAPTGHLTPFAASTINVAQPGVTMQNLVEALKSNRKNPLPEWTLSKYDGDPLSWHEWSGQFKSAIDSANLTDDEKLTYLKTLVTGKAKLAIADVAYSGRFYRDSLKTLERKFGQPQVVVGVYFDKLASYTPVKIHSSEQIIDFANFIASIIGVFRSLNYENDLRGAAMLNQAVYKLPPNLREQWSMHTVVKDMLRPTLIDFNDWLKRKAEAHERMNVSGTSKPKAEESKVKSKSKSFSATAAATGSTLSTTPRHARRTNPESKFLPCPCCKSKHPLWKCDEFKTKTPTQRAKLAADNNFCFRCVNGVHRASECDKDIQCTSPDCQNPRQHNTLLHGASRIFPLRQKKSSSPKSNKTASATVSSGSKSTCSYAATDIDTRGLIPVVLVNVSSRCGSAEVLALCDTGSVHSWVSDKLAKSLSLTGSPSKVALSGIISNQEVVTERVEVVVSSLYANPPFSFDLKSFTKSLTLGKDLIDILELQKQHPHLAPIPPIVYNYSDIQLIIGQDAYYAIHPINAFKGDPMNDPWAVQLPLGWALCGATPERTSASFVSTCFKATVEDLSLAEQVKAWYDLESYGSCVQADPRSAADKRANKILETTTVHDEDRYSVGMLWATDNVTLPNNYYASLVQLKSLERRLEKDPELKSNYIKTVHDDLQKGYVIPVGEFNPECRSSRDWYLPHHPVVNPNKPGKVRRVLNGASKFHGKSLNSCLLTGPDLLQDLLNVLLRFRQYQYAVSADIEGMFLQVGVPPPDQTCLRFLWREDPTQNVETLQYTRHIFGARDSPTCANFALQQTARDNEATYPLAAKAVQQKFYMDDYLDSVECPETALKLSQELIEMLKLGVFKLTKFISNVNDLSETVEPSVPVPQVKEIVQHPTITSHVLGLKWDHKADTLNVS